MGKPLPLVRLVSFAALLFAGCEDEDPYKLPPNPDAGPTIDMPPPSDATDAMIDANASEADLAVTLGAPGAVPTSSPLDYTIAVTNLGGRVANDVEVELTLPGGNVLFVSATGIGWTCTAAGQIVTCTRPQLIVDAAPTIAVRVTTPAIGATLVSTVTVDSATPDSNTSNDMDSVSVDVTAPADLAITIADVMDPVAPSGQIVYTIDVANAGPGAASALVVTDTLPATLGFVSASGTGWACSATGQVVTCNLAALASGADASQLTLVATAPASGATITNTASVTSGTGDPVTTNNSATVMTTVNAAADLALAMTDVSDPVVAGGTISYQLDVNNLGPNTASGITVTTQLPAGNVAFLDAMGTGWSCTNVGQLVTCTRASLIMGPAPTITINVRAPAVAGTLNAMATVVSTSSDLVAANNSDGEDTTVFASANLAIAIADAPDPVLSGGVITYTVSVSNAGPSTASSVTVTDTIPMGTSFMAASGTGWSCGFASGDVTCTTSSLPVGAAPALTIQLVAPNMSTTVLNTVSVASVTNDPMMANNTAVASTSVDASADLALTLAATPEPVAAQSTLTYTINVTNNGPRDATTVSVTNRLPDGNVVFQNATGIGWTCALAGQIVTCTRPTLLVGVAPTITINVTTPASFTSLVDQATVTSTQPDNVPGNNSQTVTSTGATPLADLSVTLADDTDPANGDGAAGCLGTSCINYTAVVANSGPQAATGVSVELTLPANGTFVNVVGTGWVCPAPAGGKITCTRAASLANGAIAPAITLTWKAPQPGGFSILLRAEVDATSTDPDLLDNIATEDTTILP